MAGGKTQRWCCFQIHCLHILEGWKGEILHIIFQKNTGLGPNILHPCHNSFLWGSEQFHFLPELSTMNSNNSALCLPDSLVKPTEQNVTNGIPGKRGVAHRLKLTTSPRVAKLHLSHRTNSEAKPNPWAKFIMPGKRRGGNKPSRPELLFPTLSPGSRSGRDCTHSRPLCLETQSCF